MRTSIGTSSGSGQTGRVIVLLSLAVLLPTACLLWFMMQAVGSERLAVRQRLVETYQDALTKHAEFNDEMWPQMVGLVRSALEGPAVDVFESFAVRRLDRPGRLGETFARARGMVIYGANGGVVYPVFSRPEPIAEPNERVAALQEQAWEAEFTQRDFGRAAQLHAEVAETAEEPAVRHAARRSQIRCLRQAGELQEALLLCRGLLHGYPGDPVDEAVEAVSELRLIEIDLVENLVPEELPNLLAEALASAASVEAAGGISTAALPSDSRIFFLQRVLRTAEQNGLLARMEPQARDALRRIEAEEVSLAAAAAYPSVESLEPVPGQTVQRLSVEGESEPLYGYHVAGGETGSAHALVVLDRENLATWLDHYEQIATADLDYRISDGVNRYVAGLTVPGAPALLAAPVGQYFPDWRVGLYPRHDSIFAQAARRQTAIYIWTGVLVTAVILLLGLVAGRILTQQMRLNRLKNDFVATVTHELKTPLSGMRVLVDTLLEGRYRDERQVREYLELISRENRRLSRLIDNFLSFSRMERNRHAFEIQAVDPELIARDAVEAVRKRFEQAGVDLAVDVPNDLPRVAADPDAMSTVLVNLLDNAFKYSGEQKQITLTASANGDRQVCFAVSDNGIGMTRRVQRRMFERFYQADRTLARTAEGCGLGLSIVRFIVDSHRGRIRVASEPGKGTRIEVHIPTA